LGRTYSLENGSIHFEVQREALMERRRRSRLLVCGGWKGRLSVLLAPGPQTALIVLEDKHKGVVVDAVVEDLADSSVALEAVQDLDLGVDVEEAARLMRPLGQIHHLPATTLNNNSECCKHSLPAL
jgi:hypothetical protein